MNAHPGPEHGPAPTQPHRTAGCAVRKEAALPPPRPPPGPHSHCQLGLLPATELHSQAGGTLSASCVRRWEQRPSHLLPWLSGGREGQLLPLPRGTLPAQPESSLVPASGYSAAPTGAWEVSLVLKCPPPPRKGGRRPHPSGLPLTPPPAPRPGQSPLTCSSVWDGAEGGGRRERMPVSASPPPAQALVTEMAALPTAHSALGSVGAAVWQVTKEEPVAASA